MEDEAEYGRASKDDRLDENPSFAGMKETR